MSEDVSRLKELLFEDESRTLADLNRRMDDVYQRAGSTERFTTSVASVLDDALRQAEVDRHTEVSHAIAPLIVQTIKSEIRGSQDELAEALYPSLGRMVKAYVVSAIRDLMDEINRRLESNAFMLRLRSLLTGRPVAELAFAEGQRLRVEEVYLIRGGTGVLVGHWPPGEPASTRDKRVSGILTAINEIATETFEPDESSLRRIDLGKALIYLRASPAHLLAIKCRGVAPQSVEQLIDEQVLATIERLRALLNKTSEPSLPERTINTLLGDLQTNLETTIAEQQAKVARERTGPSPAVIIIWSMALVLTAWASWSLYAGYATAQARARAEAAMAEQGLLTGYPVHVDVDRRGRDVALSGLVPSAEAGQDALRRIREALPTSQVSDRTTALPSGLDQARADIAATQTAIESLRMDIEGLRGDLAQMGGSTQGQLSKLGDELKSLNAKLAQSEEARQADVAELREEIARAVAPTPRQRLQAWIDTNALFFGKDTDYRDGQAAAAALDELASLIKDTDVLVRVVGFTDEKGGEERNTPLSQARAERTVAELTKRGIPQERLVAVGRNDSTELSPVLGEASPNRRVVFEIGFKDEGAQ
jgi:outer membrane protein OmpA-like peptidoglycan-associated protein